MKIAIIVRSPSAGVCIVTCPALPGCVASGASREEAIRQMQTAVWGYLASLDVAAPSEIDLVDPTIPCNQAPPVGAHVGR